MYLGVLPTLDGFWQLALVLFPFCVVGGYLMLSSNVKVAGVAGLTTIVAIKLMNLQAHQTFSFSHVVGFFLWSVRRHYSGVYRLHGHVADRSREEVYDSGQGGSSVRAGNGWPPCRPMRGRGAASRTAFAQESARQLGLCVMWGKFLNYRRLPAGSHSTVTNLTAAIQSTILHTDRA